MYIHTNMHTHTHTHTHTHYSTSAKIIQLNEYGCRDAPCEQSWKQGIPLAILSRILAQSCVTLCLNYVGRVTHDCANILDSIAKGISLFPRFFAWCIPTSIFIQLNKFCTCSTYFSQLRACVRICVTLRLDHVLV